MAENVIFSEIEKALVEKLGHAELIEEALEKVSPLLDEKGMKAYLLLVDSFISLDPSFSIFLLRTGFGTLSAVKGQAARRDALEALLEMGRSKWSVVEHAYRKLPLLSNMP